MVQSSKKWELFSDTQMKQYPENLQARKHGEDTHASKVLVSTIKQIFFENLNSSWNIRYIITQIYVIVGTILYR